ncbi:MAG: serine--tRNA ligase [Patescibacteria group bacterium]
MIDIKLLVENPKYFKDASKKKLVEVDVAQIVELKNRQNQLIKSRDELRYELNQGSTGKPTEEKQKELREVKAQIKILETEINDLENKIYALARMIPNPAFDDVPIGKDDSENVSIREVGEKIKFNYEPKDYLTIAEGLDIIDVKRAGKVSGSRFGYLKNEGAWLELGLMNLAFNTLANENILEEIIKKNNLNVSAKTFVPMIPPVMLKPEVFAQLGYVDRGDIDYFKIKDDELVLVGTSEQSLVPYFKDEILEEKNLPVRFLGFSSCFRREAGSYGKDTRGILRVHQFDKLEMVSFSTQENSKEEHKFLLAIEEYLMQQLELPYRVLNICAGDLGDPAAAKFDIEVWFPFENKYRETHSTSNTTDFQARRLNTRYRSKGETKFVHILNGTAFSQRPILAIIENNQTKEGWVKVPKVLQKYLPFDIIKR